MNMNSHTRTRTHTHTHTRTHASTHILFWSFIYIHIHIALLDIWQSFIQAFYYSSGKYIDPGKTYDLCSCSISYTVNFSVLLHSNVCLAIHSHFLHFMVWRMRHYLIVWWWWWGGRYNHYILYEQNTTNIPVLMDSWRSLLCSQRPTTWPHLQPAHIFTPYFSNTHSMSP